MTYKIRFEGNHVIADGTRYLIVDTWYDHLGNLYQLAEGYAFENLSSYLAIINGKYWYEYSNYQEEPERGDVESAYLTDLQVKENNGEPVDVTEMSPERKMALQYRKERIDNEIKRLQEERVLLADILRIGRRISLSDIKEITQTGNVGHGGEYEFRLLIEDGEKRYGEKYDYILYNPNTQIIDDDILLPERLGDLSTTLLCHKLDVIIDGEKGWDVSATHPLKGMDL